MRWESLLPPLSTAERVGSTATMRTLGRRSFKYSPTPVMVPPVPTPATNASTFPSVAARISSAVLDAARRIELLELREDLRPSWLAEALDPDDRSVARELRDVVGDRLSRLLGLNFVHARSSFQGSNSAIKTATNAAATTGVTTQ